MKTIHKWFDDVAIRLAAARMPRLEAHEARLEEAQRLLQSPDFFPRGTTAPELEFLSAREFRFASSAPMGHTVNDTVRGCLYRCSESWQTKPAVLLLHGWNDVLDHRFYFPRHAAKLNRAGLNALTLQLPLHFDRRPREWGRRANFLSADLLQTIRAFQQALADIRSSVNWLLSQGCPSVSLWGVSLGGLLTGLSVCTDSRLASATLVVPATHLERLINEIAFCKTIREALHGSNVDLSSLNPAGSTPLMDRSRILLVESIYDQFIAPDSTEDLWRRWNEPEIWRLRAGHIGVLWQRGLTNRLVRWVASKAHESGARQTGCLPGNTATANGPLA